MKILHCILLFLSLKLDAYAQKLNIFILNPDSSPELLKIPSSKITDDIYIARGTDTLESQFDADIYNIAIKVCKENNNIDQPFVVVNPVAWQIVGPLWSDCARDDKGINSYQIQSSKQSWETIFDSVVFKNINKISKLEYIILYSYRSFLENAPNHGYSGILDTTADLMCPVLDLQTLPYHDSSYNTPIIPLCNGISSKLMIGSLFYVYIFNELGFDVNFYNNLNILRMSGMNIFSDNNINLIIRDMLIYSIGKTKTNKMKISSPSDHIEGFTDVCEVMFFPSATISPAPKWGTKLDLDFSCSIIVDEDSRHILKSKFRLQSVKELQKVTYSFILTKDLHLEKLEKALPLSGMNMSSEDPTLFMMSIICDNCEKNGINPKFTLNKKSTVKIDDKEAISTTDYDTNLPNKQIDIIRSSGEDNTCIKLKNKTNISYSVSQTKESCRVELNYPFKINRIYKERISYSVSNYVVDTTRSVTIHDLNNAKCDDVIEALQDYKEDDKRDETKWSIEIDSDLYVNKSKVSFCSEK